MMTFVGGAVIDSPMASPLGGSQGMLHDIGPCTHLPLPSTTPQSNYNNVWESSANSSRTDSIASYKRRFGRNLCRIVTACAAVLIILAVLGIVGIAIYLGYVSKEEERPNHTDKFIGNVRILQGDSWMPDLLFNDSPAFRAKAAKYKTMFKDLFANSALGPAFEKAEVNQFTALDSRENNGFDLLFQLFLDRRKIPFWHLKDTTTVIEKLMVQEFTSPSPVSFQNLQIVPESFSVKKVDSASNWSEFDSSRRKNMADSKYEVVPLNNTEGGILRVKTPEDLSTSEPEFVPEIRETTPISHQPSHYEIKTTTTHRPRNDDQIPEGPVEYPQSPTVQIHQDPNRGPGIFEPAIEEQDTGFKPMPEIISTKEPHINLPQTTKQPDILISTSDDTPKTQESLTEQEKRPEIEPKPQVPLTEQEIKHQIEPKPQVPQIEQKIRPQFEPKPQIPQTEQKLRPQFQPKPQEPQHEEVPETKEEISKVSDDFQTQHLPQVPTLTTTEDSKTKETDAIELQKGQDLSSVTEDEERKSISAIVWPEDQTEMEQTPQSFRPYDPKEIHEPSTSGIKQNDEIKQVVVSTTINTSNDKRPLEENTWKPIETIYHHRPNVHNLEEEKKSQNYPDHSHIETNGDFRADNKWKNTSPSSDLTENRDSLLNTRPLNFVRPQHDSQLPDYNNEHIQNSNDPSNSDFKSPTKSPSDEISSDINKDEFHDRLGDYPTESKRPDPTLEDIQFVLENLLFLAASNSFNLLNKSSDSTSESEDFLDIDDTSDYYFDDLINDKPSDNSEVLYDQFANANNQDATYHEEVRSPPYPLDRFRYQNTKDGLRKHHTNGHQKEPTYYDIHYDLSNHDNLRFNKKFGDTAVDGNRKKQTNTPAPQPVYVHSSTTKSRVRSDKENNPEVIIPVISGKTVKYIRINRTSNYPKVVVVNLSDYDKNETIDVSSALLREESRKLDLPSGFLNDILNLLSVVKDSDQVAEESKLTTTLDKNWLNKLKNKIYAIDKKSLTILEKTSFKDLFGNFTKSKYNFQSLLTKFRKIWGSFGSTKSGNRQPKLDPYFSSNGGNSDLPKSNVDTEMLTLFVVKKKNETGGKVISVPGPSQSMSLKGSKKLNSPIHVFTYKGNQSLDDLLSEIFHSLSEKDEKIEEINNVNREGTPHIDANDQVEPVVPPGEDSLKVIELISGVLNNNNNVYLNSLLEGSDDTIIEDNEIKGSSSQTVKPTKSTSKPTLDTIHPKPVATSLDNFNEIATKTSTNEIKENANKTFLNKYYHDLFPVMTRPMNPIKTKFTSTSKPSTTTSTVATTTVSDIKVSGNVSLSTSVSKTKELKHRNCTEGFRCANGECAIGQARCNMIRECSDNSDEVNCTCSDILKSQHYHRKICDGIIDCWDKSDEVNCDWCETGHFICTGYQKCVEPSRVCDGLPDCPNGDDERDCVTIAPDLVGANSVDYYDEGYLMVRRKGVWGKLCVENFETAVAKAGVAWTIGDLGKAVCNTLTFDSFNRVEKAYDSSPPISRSVQRPYYEIHISYKDQSSSFDPYDQDTSHVNSKRSLSDDIVLDQKDSLTGTRGSFSSFFATINSNSKESRTKRDVSKNHLNLEFQETKCVSRDVIKLQCKGLQCGVRPRVSTQLARTMKRRKIRIVGGNNSSPGAWPWHAALYKEGEYQCGATLISERWLISAGHCFYSARNDYWVARLGALRRGTKFPSAFEQIQEISHIFVHPKYVSQGFINDISLLRMKNSVRVNDFVRPICLPTPGAEVNDGQHCTLVGWGQLFEVQKVFPDTLQEVEVPVISTTECRKRTIFLPLYRITEDMFCAGYDRGGRDACLGDSGGPLMCQKSDGRWEVMGVTSNGYGCARPNRPGVYTKVVNYLKWINQVIELSNDGRVIPVKTNCAGHRCLLGRCVPESKVCDGKADCSDGTDEQGCSLDKSEV